MTLAFHFYILQVRAGARALMAEVGQGPVSLSREVPGFVLNRMQVGGKLNVDHFCGFESPRKPCCVSMP